MDIEKIITKEAPNLRKKKNVVAVAKGTKWTNGHDTGEEALLVFVSKKEPLASLNTKDRIAPVINGVKVDVVGKTGEFNKLATYTARERPAQPGISCGHLWITAGTIGGVFKDRQGDTVILSNNHVLADENRALRGHQTVQPGPYDGGRASRDRIGLLKFFRPIRKPGRLSYEHYNKKRIPYNVEDSAIATIDNPDNVLVDIKNIGAPTGWNDVPTIGMNVQKTGRTTGHTNGTIIGLNATVWVNYETGVYEFRDQILTTNMSSGGDSGSLLLDTSDSIVGLLFAGSASSTVHNPGKYPRTTFGLEIINLTPIEETLSFTITEDGNPITHTYTPATLASAIKDAKVNARNGKVVSIVVNYSVQPQP